MKKPASPLNISIASNKEVAKEFIKGILKSHKQDTLNKLLILEPYYDLLLKNELSAKKQAQKEFFVALKNPQLASSYEVKFNI